MSSKVKPVEQQRRTIAICWFKRDTYQEAKGLMADPDRLYGSYDQWLKEALMFEREMVGRDVKTKRVTFHIQSFVLFCRIRNMVPDAGARMLWAAQEAQKP
ncbi:MAG: hypothetical protein P4L82_16125 [Ancalomicrobiaceae bacterium]|nr:hypothetical protein [Ancalomicrobiaceae bacterium]